MQREYGLQISNKVSKKLLQSTLHVAEGKLFCQMKERCMVSNFSSDQHIVKQNYSKQEMNFKLTMK